MVRPPQTGKSKAVRDDESIRAAFATHRRARKARHSGLLIGDGVSNSASPFQFETEAHALGIDLRYDLLDTKQLGLTAKDMPEVLRALTRLNYTGFTITHPFKEVFVRLASRLSPDACAIGAVNTLVRDRDNWVGHNTDWSGFVASHELGLGKVSKDRVVLIGAGGAGRAVAYGMLKVGAGQLAIHDLDAARAEAVVDDLSRLFGVGRVLAASNLAGAIAEADGLINATTVGMFGASGSPIKKGWLRPGLWVADIVVSPRVTDLIRDAVEMGAPHIDGLGMVALQAAHAFQLFTGQAPDTDRMVANARAILGNRAA